MQNTVVQHTTTTKNVLKTSVGQNHGVVLTKKLLLINNSPKNTSKNLKKLSNPLLVFPLKILKLVKLLITKTHNAKQQNVLKKKQLKNQLKKNKSKAKKKSKNNVQNSLLHVSNNVNKQNIYSLNLYVLLSFRYVLF